jgi:hypothetical protein
MKTEKIIHVRMSEDLHSRLNEEASKKGVSASSIIRNAISDSPYSSNPYHSTSLLFVFAYLEQARCEPKDVCEYEVRHLLDIINNHYPNLEKGLQLLFDNVIIGLEEVLEDMINDEENMSGYVSFGNKETNNIQVDFNKFYELTDGRLPYR